MALGSNGDFSDVFGKMQLPNSAQSLAQQAAQMFGPSALKGAGNGAAELAQVLGPNAAASLNGSAAMAAQAVGGPMPGLRGAASAVVKGSPLPGIRGVVAKTPEWAGYGKGMLGKFGNMMRQTPGAALPELEAAPGLFQAGGAFAPGSLGMAGGLGAAGIGAGSLLHHFWNDENSTADDMASDALKGAGIGAGIGTIIPGVGTLIGGGVGALIGGGLGGALGYFGARDEGQKAVSQELDAQTKKLTELMGQFGVSADLKQQALMQLQLLASDAHDKGGVRKVAEQVHQMVVSMIPQDQANNKRKTSVAAMQAWMAPMLRDSLNKSQYYADQYGTAAAAAAGGISDPNLRNALTAQAKTMPADTAAQNAYAMQQFASLPAMYGYNTPVDNSTGMPATDLSSILSATPA